MKPKLIAASKLAPQFNIPSSLETKANQYSLLLGQDRVTSTYKLFSKLEHQHLYIADYPSVDRSKLIDALVSSYSSFSEQYLSAAKTTNAIVLEWFDSPAPNNTGIITTKQNTYEYLTGNLSKVDLFGRTNNKNGIAEYIAGALARSNIVFISAEALLNKPNLWSMLMDTLNSGFYRVNSSLSQVPLNCKIVLVGGASLFTELKYHDETFNKYFPLLAEMVSELDIYKHSELEYLSWLEQLKPASSIVEMDAYPILLSYSSSLVEHQHRLALDFVEMVHLLAQAAALSKSKRISAESVLEAINLKQQRHNTSEEYSLQNFEDKFISLQTEGKMVGQINGLTVIDTGDYSYGEPARITCTAHYGDGEVADIERKSELAGNIHAKGMMILSSCLYRIFGRDAPLHLDANIVFEQSYQEIDGDSASVAEYCCLLSAISETPIEQSIAVTGALDQFGNVQAIGGVNEKITGFFNLCQKRKLTGTQGVIIPASNALQLNLPQEIITAVEQGKFSIFQVDHIDQVIELLLGTPAGSLNENNTFPKDSLYWKVQQRLNELAGEYEPEPTFIQKVLTKIGIRSD
ncbi:AAA family ATPase [Shewanella sp. 202IG2-18]|uniref:S16 family serine protease n=1 Tax=Parashewanella hymeniacidonis TaxID=2807618 RepID=UPI00195F97A5|nr:S16 family serine protease [Parashewanella hymeniacidonis]MBM7071379.1 AAA family ATPase [Parashewanella hymeniacidonis]